MNPTFSADFFKRNRHNLRKACSTTPLLIINANGLLQRTGDNPYSFQQDSNFWYLTGIEQPDMILVVDGSEEYLIVPELSNYQSIFDGDTDDGALQKISGIADIVPSTVGWQRLTAALKKYNQAGTPQAMPPYVDVYGMYTNPSRCKLIEQLHARHDSVELVDIRPQLVTLRCIKQPLELTALQAAIDITASGLTRVAGKLQEYQYEYEIEAELSYAFRSAGAAGHAFNPIVAGGPRACVLHNVGNNAALQPDELIELDVGAEVSHYAADISRVYIQAQPSPRQQAVYDAVLAVQNYAISLLKPGVILKDYEKLVETEMGDHLIALQLLSAPEAAVPANVRRYFPHAASHFLGLDVHDVGDYRQPLTENMVVTCEPGIYIPNEGIGIRIEDDVLITKAGNKVLSAALPRVLK